MPTAIFEPDSKLGRSVQRPVDYITARRHGLSKQCPIDFARANEPKVAYAPSRPQKSLDLITYPQGHGPYHRHPELSADVIASFVHSI